MGRKTRWSDEQLKEAVARRKSMRQVLFDLGLRPLGGNYLTVRRRISDLGMSTTHWTGQGWLRGRSKANRHRRTLADVLTTGSRYQSSKLKARLIKEGVLEARCSNCRLAEWQEGAMPLELDHLDGDRENNRLENLRLLCPNCHAMTNTYRARNARYPHIPSLTEIQAGIATAGSLKAYAGTLGVTSDAVRWWLKSPRLHRQKRVEDEPVSHARVVELVDIRDLMIEPRGGNPTGETRQIR